MADRFRGLQIDDQLEPSWLFDREIGRPPGSQQSLRGSERALSGNYPNVITLRITLPSRSAEKASLMVSRRMR
jgi:hypothetical protein